MSSRQATARRSALARYDGGQRRLCGDDHETRDRARPRPLGGDGARIALGCGNFGGIGSAPAVLRPGADEAQAFALMDAAWELGIGYFDTADAYGGGRSETAIGGWIALARACGPLLTTKTFNPMDAGADHGLAPERIERQLHGEPRAARRRPGRPLPRARARPRRARCARRSARSSACAARAGSGRSASATTTRPSSRRRSPPGTPTRSRTPTRCSCAATSAACSRSARERGVAYVAFSPLAGGWLTGKYRRGEPFPAGLADDAAARAATQPFDHATRSFDALERCEALAAERGISMAGVALAWLLADDRVTQIVVGPDAPGAPRAGARGARAPARRGRARASDERVRLSVLVLERGRRDRGAADPARCIEAMAERARRARARRGVHAAALGRAPPGRRRASRADAGLARRRRAGLLASRRSA